MPPDPWPVQQYKQLWLDYLDALENNLPSTLSFKEKLEQLKKEAKENYSDDWLEMCVMDEIVRTLLGVQVPE